MKKILMTTVSAIAIAMFAMITSSFSYDGTLDVNNKYNFTFAAKAEGFGGFTITAIESTLALTAAHTVYNCTTKKVAATVLIKVGNRVITGTVVAIHPDFKASCRWDRDVAIIRTTEVITRTPVSLADDDGSKWVAIGNGSYKCQFEAVTEKPIKASCKNDGRRRYSVVQRLNTAYSDSSHTFSEGFLPSDSGGALVSVVDKKPELIGVTVGQAHQQRFAVKLSHIRDFVTPHLTSYTSSMTR